MSGDMAVTHVGDAGTRENAISLSSNDNNYNPTNETGWFRKVIKEEWKNQHVNNSNVSVWTPGYGAGGI